ncbi:MAG: hypothetical protein H0T89_30410 [Deltaproteobacteria bacterium]|nr:hypothetical protein [Deltaproteobacteria bacterium]
MRDTAVWQRGILVRRPVLMRGRAVSHPEIVGGRLARLRDGLAEANNAIVEARQQLASSMAVTLVPTRQAMTRARVNLLDALDALDDLFGALPLAHPDSLALEILRAATHRQRAHLELARAAVDGADSPPRSVPIWLELRGMLDMPKLGELAHDAAALTIKP